MNLPDGASFVSDGAQESDVEQGGIGDCWFVSALSSLAVDLPDRFDDRTRRFAAERVIQSEHNNTAISSSSPNFKFNFWRLGEWHEITVDQVLPKYRRARPSKSNEWWVPLTEKAYATFNLSYDNIHGKTCVLMYNLHQNFN